MYYEFKKEETVTERKPLFDFTQNVINRDRKLREEALKKEIENKRVEMIIEYMFKEMYGNY